MADSFVKLKTATQKQSIIGPKIAPSTPRKYIPPAIDKPVRYSWPPLTRKNILYLFFARQLKKSYS